MPLCVALQADGTLVATGQTVDACTGYVMLSGSEYAVQNWLATAFATPTPEQAAGWFVGCFGVVLVSYICGRWAGQVLSVFSA